MSDIICTILLYTYNTTRVCLFCLFLFCFFRRLRDHAIKVAQRFATYNYHHSAALLLNISATAIVSQHCLPTQTPPTTLTSPTYHLQYLWFLPLKLLTQHLEV